MLTTRESPGPFDRLLYQQVTKAHYSFREQLSHESVHVLASEVITRLSSRFADRKPPELVIPAERLEAFCHALVREDDETCLSMVDATVVDAHSVDQVYLAFLGAAARLLGTWWEEDRATFSEVTVGTGRIYAMLCALRPVLIETKTVQPKHALFAAVPGEQHFLGVTMAADMFRARGWDIELFTGQSHEDLVETVDRLDPAFIGLSAHGKRSTVPLTRLIVAIRAGHPGTYILVSGNAADNDVSVSDLTGADLVTTDIEAAYSDMQRMVAAR